MGLSKLDHVNVRTANLEAMERFYVRALGLESGWRPPFDFNGRWLYCGADPIVHLVEVERHQETVAPRVEHFALAGSGLAGFLERLRSAAIPYNVLITPGSEVRQVHLHDPDGNHIHCDFPADEQADLGPYPGA